MFFFFLLEVVFFFRFFFFPHKTCFCLQVFFFFGVFFFFLFRVTFSPDLNVDQHSNAPLYSFRSVGRFRAVSVLFAHRACLSVRDILRLPSWGGGLRACKLSPRNDCNARASGPRLSGASAPSSWYLRQRSRKLICRAEPEAGRGCGANAARRREFPPQQATQVVARAPLSPAVAPKPSFGRAQWRANTWSPASSWHSLAIRLRAPTTPNPFSRAVDDGDEDEKAIVAELICQEQLADPARQDQQRPSLLCSPNFQPRQLRMQLRADTSSSSLHPVSVACSRAGPVVGLYPGKFPWNPHTPLPLWFLPPPVGTEDKLSRPVAFDRCTFSTTGPVAFDQPLRQVGDQLTLFLRGPHQPSCVHSSCAATASLHLHHRTLPPTPGLSLASHLRCMSFAAFRADC